MPSSATEQLAARRAAALPEIPAELRALRGVGPALEEKLARLGVHRPADLLFLLPQRYEDRTRRWSIGSLRPGQRAVVEGEIALAEVVIRRRRSLLCRMGDGTGQLTLRFFYFSKAQQEGLVRGMRIRCYGEARPGPAGLEMVHPEYRLLRPGSEVPMEEGLTPVYPTTEGVQQFRIRGLVGQAMDRFLPLLTDWVPPAALAELGLPSLHDSLQLAHYPNSPADAAGLLAGNHPCLRRLGFDEMLAHFLSLRRVRERSRREQALPLPPCPELEQRFLGGLGFTLTRGQRDTLAEIGTDLAQAHPMMRLVQGDVGCGKTVVAAAAALRAVARGHQVAIMAPTELLAEQHRRSFGRWFPPLGIRVAWLSGIVGKK
jgi:ATP-dependent DNA helicase RecG